MLINEKTSRENVLKGIRNASLVKVENAYSGVNQDAAIYNQPEDDDLLVQFATELTHIGGSFVYCSNLEEFYSELSILLKARNSKSYFTIDKVVAKILSEGNIAVETNPSNLTLSPMIITQCETLVARLGTVVVSSRQMSGRLANFIPDVHIVLASPNQVVPAVKEAIDFLKSKYSSLPSMISFITGPSRTADIEKTLVMGAHGPREVIVFILENF